MADEFKNTHDSLFKLILKDIEKAKEFLGVMLPEEIRSRIDLNSLREEQSSFINKNLKELFADMVFRVKIKDDSGENEAFLSLLFEHKSYKDKHVHFQILNYLSELYLKQTRTRKGLRPVIPIIFYNGKTNWKLGTIHEQFDAAYTDFLDVVPHFQITMIDLAEMSEESILNISQAWIRAVVLAQKYSKHPEQLIQRVSYIFETLGSLPNRNFLKQITIYVFNFTDSKTEELRSIIHSLSPGIKTEIMTTYERIKLEGEVKNTEDGIVRGYKNKVSISQLSLVFGISEAEVKAILKKKSLL